MQQQPVVAVSAPAASSATTCSGGGSSSSSSGGGSSSVVRKVAATRPSVTSLEAAPSVSPAVVDAQVAAKPPPPATSSVNGPTGSLSTPAKAATPAAAMLSAVTGMGSTMSMEASSTAARSLFSVSHISTGVSGPLSSAAAVMSSLEHLEGRVMSVMDYLETRLAHLQSATTGGGQQRSGVLKSVAAAGAAATTTVTVPTSSIGSAAAAPPAAASLDETPQPSTSFIPNTASLANNVSDGSMALVFASLHMSGITGKHNPLPQPTPTHPASSSAYSPSAEAPVAVASSSSGAAHNVTTATTASGSVARRRPRNATVAPADADRAPITLREQWSGAVSPSHFAVPDDDDDHYHEPLSTTGGADSPLPMDDAVDADSSYPLPSRAAEEGPLATPFGTGSVNASESDSARTQHSSSGSTNSGKPPLASAPSLALSAPTTVSSIATSSTRPVNAGLGQTQSPFDPRRTKSPSISMRSVGGSGDDAIRSPPYDDPAYDPKAQSTGSRGVEAPREQDVLAGLLVPHMLQLGGGGSSFETSEESPASKYQQLSALFGSVNSGQNMFATNSDIVSSLRGQQNSSQRGVTFMSADTQTRDEQQHASSGSSHSHHFTTNSNNKNSNSTLQPPAAAVAEILQVLRASRSQLSDLFRQHAHSLVGTLLQTGNGQNNSGAQADGPGSLANSLVQGAGSAFMRPQMSAVLAAHAAQQGQRRDRLLSVNHHSEMDGSGNDSVLSFIASPSVVSYRGAPLQFNMSGVGNVSTTSSIDHQGGHLHHVSPTGKDAAGRPIDIKLGLPFVDVPKSTMAVGATGTPSGGGIESPSRVVLLKPTPPAGGSGASPSGGRPKLRLAVGYESVPSQTIPMVTPTQVITTCSSPAEWMRSRSPSPQALAVSGCSASSPSHASADPIIAVSSAEVAKQQLPQMNLQFLPIAPNSGIGTLLSVTAVTQHGNHSASGIGLTPMERPVTAEPGDIRDRSSRRVLASTAAGQQPGGDALNTSSTSSRDELDLLDAVADYDDPIGMGGDTSSKPRMTVDEGDSMSSFRPMLRGKSSSPQASNTNACGATASVDVDCSMSLTCVTPQVSCGRRDSVPPALASSGGDGDHSGIDLHVPVDSVILPRA